MKEEIKNINKYLHFRIFFNCVIHFLCIIVLKQYLINLKLNNVKCHYICLERI